MGDSTLDCDVLIIGGGPVGLFLACELGAYGVKVELYEQEPGTSVHPKANTHSARSMELYRRHGLTTPFRTTGWPADRTADIVYRTRMLGHELGRVQMPSPAEALAAAKEGNTRWPTPEPQIRASQLKLEPLLLARAKSFPNVTLTFGAEVTSFEDHGDHVSARVGGPIRRARYLVACDGARSTTRSQLGLAFVGEGGLNMDFMGGMMVTTFFRAPGLLGLMPGRPAWQFWTLNAERRNLIVSLDGGELFVLHAQLKPGQELKDFDFSAALTAVVGQPIAHQHLSAGVWRAGKALVAGHYGNGRVAIAGDAAHLFTPTGGLGVNTGIEDAANLSWKLAAAVRGWAGPGLLASYENERKPIAERNTKFALSLAQAVSACPVTAEFEHDSEAGVASRAAAARHIEAVARNEFDHPGLQLGSRYDGAGLVFSGGARGTDVSAALGYEPSWVPGGRLPHQWVGGDKSTLDFCGHRFTLLSFGAPSPDAARFAEEAKRRNIPFVAHALNVSVPSGLRQVLVRPDQIIAWAGSDETASAVFDIATGLHAPGNGTFDPSDKTLG